MKILVCGGREWGVSRADGLEKTINGIVIKMWTYGVLDAVFKLRGGTELVHGACPTGADNLADRWAQKRGVVTHRHPAAWSTHSKQAGPLRNAEMLVMHDVGLVVAFPGGSGTRNMIKLAESDNIEVIRFGKHSLSDNLSVDGPTKS